MTQHLWMVHLGPVQEFIAQGRRSRDLWFGSHLLSELARAAAKCAAAAKVELVFPAVSGQDLDPQDAPMDKHHKPVVPLPNHVLGIVPAGVDPAELAEGTRRAVLDRLHSLGDQVRRDYAEVLEAPDALWREQLDTVLEFYAAWVPYSDPAQYARARHELEHALGARRNLRQFSPWQHDRTGAPKSSLDGGRVSVLAHGGARQGRTWRQLRLGQGEQLDAVGLIKRAGGEPEQFVPLANVAAADWLRRAGEQCPELLRRAAELCGELDVGRVQNPTLPWSAWPGSRHGYDAEVFYEGRARAVLDECEAGPDLRRQHTQLLKAMHKKLMAPSPYVVCLVADGDRVGAALDRLGSPEAHRVFSQQLAAFTAGCQAIVAAHQGLLIYSGGDDVLAFVGIERALPLARELYEHFAARMAPVAGGQPAPTLSVGLGIGHLMDGMAHLLALGRRALQLAKGDGVVSDAERRDALGILLDKRSGGTTRWRARWRDGSGQPAEVRIEALGSLLAERRLPRGKVYEVAAAMRLFPKPDDLPLAQPCAPESHWTFALREEVGRVLARAHASRGLSLAEVGLPTTGDNYRELHTALLDWIAACRIAFLLHKNPEPSHA